MKTIGQLKKGDKVICEFGIATVIALYITKGIAFVKTDMGTFETYSFGIANQPNS